MSHPAEESLKDTCTMSRLPGISLLSVSVMISLVVKGLNLRMETGVLDLAHCFSQSSYSLKATMSMSLNTHILAIQATDQPRESPAVTIGSPVTCWDWGGGRGHLVKTLQYCYSRFSSLFFILSLPGFHVTFLHLFFLL